MARNSEKAQSMLFRFRASQAASLGIVDIGRQRRPKAPTSITALPVAEKWRSQILREISRKVTKIQESSLSDYQVRDLNDEINALFAEKGRWERRIRELGGPNYSRGGGGLGVDGEAVGGRGYRYFGRARELPGVKEMFEASAAKAKEEREGAKGGGGGGGEGDVRRRGLDARYFGWGPEEQNEQDREKILKHESEREVVLREEMLSMGDDWVDSDADEADGRAAKEGTDTWEPLPGDAGDGARWILPTAAEVQEELVERRRRRLLDRIGDE
ncbi:MAG: hypothetical protein M1828_007423 [Chrysothrix sp. TS-e1954]|nr:MAG: hypothetical protein M1828_007423 [Chrysothrix sp. TS-e1954]